MLKSLVIVLLVGLAAARKSYDGYIVVDVTPSTKAQGMLLNEQRKADIQLDFWDSKIAAGHATRIMLHRSHLSTFSERLAEHGMGYEVFESNLQQVIETERTEIEERRANREKVFDINDFNTLADINSWLAEKQGECAAAGLVCTWGSVGTSVEGRAINLFTITANTGTPPVIYMDSITHAREWLSSATVLKFVESFMTTYGTDDDTTHFLDTYRWDFIVVVNPDGYEFSWIDDRLWRKNRAINAGSACIGVDLNRNHDYQWGWSGYGALPCATDYLGPTGSSEPETQVTEAYIRSIAANCLTMVTIHAYGYYWLHPWGATMEEGNDNAPCDFAEDHADLFRAATAAAEAAQTSNGDTWYWGNSCNVIYTATGATDDWSKGVAGIKYSYNPELRGNGFVILPSEIEVSYQEVRAAMVAMVADLEANPQP